MLSCQRKGLKTDLNIIKRSRIRTILDRTGENSVVLLRMILSPSRQVARAAANLWPIEHSRSGKRFAALAGHIPSTSQGAG
jgi:hypothetical protein